MRERRRPSRTGPGKVLVATDFSEGSAWAVRRATLLPLRPRAEVTLLHVIPPNLPAASAIRAEAAAVRLLEELAATVANEAAGAGRPRPSMVPVVAVGQPHVEIVRRARAAEAELVVVGRHGRRPLRDLFLSPTAARVIRKAGIPVLVVAREPAGAYRHPLAALALEDADLGVLQSAQWLLPETVRGIALHACEPPFRGIFAPDLFEKEAEAWRRRCERDAGASLARLLRGAGAAGRRWTPAVRRGDPRLLIPEEAARRKADLVVLSTHGRTGLTHALLGSVAEEVLETLPCDALVARPSRFSFRMP
jgi:nucleotide-binding universal stress UspA family protein